MYPSPSSESAGAPLPRRRLYCLGDSLTFGYGVSPRERWLNLLPESIPWRLMNRGLCNDIFYSGTDAGARANMGAMIQQLLTAGALVLVGIPMPIVPGWHPEEWGAVVDFAAAEELLYRYADWLRAYCAAFHVPTVDFASAFLAEDGSLRRELYLDGLHPSPEGHRLMAWLLCKRLAELEGGL